MPAPFRLLLGMTLALAPPPPLPPLQILPGPAPGGSSATSLKNGASNAGIASGRVVIIGGRRQQARWQWQQATPAQAEALWLTLELLEGQLGVTSRSRSDGSLVLDWFGRQLVVSPEGQRSLDDEVAVEVSALVRPLGLQPSHRGDTLSLTIEPPPLDGVRHGRSADGRRIVLDLKGATWIRREADGLLLGLSGQEAQVRALEALGLTVRRETGQLLLQPSGGQRLEQVITLGEPFRIALELGSSTPQSGGLPSAEAGARTQEARLRAMLPAQVTWQKQVLTVGSRSVLVNAIRLDPRLSTLTLQPLTGSNGMKGLNSLVSLASSRQALIAINGGYFNRVRRLPLGALRDGGRWLSGPILQRGVLAWRPQALPRFGRLSLEETVLDRSGERWPLLSLNSGYVQRGLSRYTADWGPSYVAQSGGERAILIRDGRVQALIENDQLKVGQPLAPGDSLVVARGGAPLPGGPGDPLTLISRPSNDLGDEPNVLGGGPLLVSGGQIVLDGERERFSPAFLSQGAPRTVVGSDGQQLWLLTLEGVGDSGPTLGQAAQLARELGLQEALNLDGGSSTGLVLAGVQTVKGRGVAGSVHNGLGLVPTTPLITRTLPK